MRRRAHPLLHALRFAAFLSAAELGAQQTAVLRAIGTPSEDRARLDQLRGASADGFLLRDGARPDTNAAGLRLILPELRITANSALVAEQNDGSLWSGRGLNVLVRGGVTYGWRNLRITLAPEVTTSQNAPFEVPAARVPEWSGFASPWRTRDIPADLPLRFGDERLTAVHPGQSALVASFSRAEVGISTGNLWWGPGVRNALILSDHPPGIPRAFVQLPAPIATPLGNVEGQLFVGGLTESLYFDRLSANDLRSVSGLAITLAPSATVLRGLTVGLARLVIAPVSGAGGVAGHAMDALTTWNGGNARDQMTSVFGRWIAPESGFEFWAEYARSRLPATLREALTEPNADMGWTLGLQWALPRDDGSLRFQVEFTDVAQSAVDSTHPPRDWGTGLNVVQGFTQQGQMLGLASGPGSTDGWVAVDRVRDRWSVGGFFARTRWENDAFYREGIHNFFAHDVSLIAGLRGQLRTVGLDADASLGMERRYNYLFENGTVTPGHRGQRTVDNVRLTLTLSPRPRTITR